LLESVTGTPLNLNYLTFNFDNLFCLDDFGYDSTGGYYYSANINKKYIRAAEGEQLNNDLRQQ
jgi:hypothetical protein